MRIQRHISYFPEEVKALENTCKSLFGRTILPDLAITSFVPIGHISLDAWSADPLLHTSPSEGIYSLTAFYVSEALQNMGLGGAALRMCEEYVFKRIHSTRCCTEQCKLGSQRETSGLSQSHYRQLRTRKFGWIAREG